MRNKPVQTTQAVVVLATALLLALSLTEVPAVASDFDASMFRGTAGKAVRDGSYPFMTAVLNEDLGRDDYYRQYCGGTLIHPEWVLTAAHCVAEVPVGKLAVAVGRTVLTSSDGHRSAVADVRIHPDFGEPTVPAHDVALLLLADPATEVAPIAPAGPDDDSFEMAGSELTVLGWGSTGSLGRPRFPDRLQETSVPVVADEDCGRSYRREFDPDSMLCAGTGGQDSCQGDSGGPLFAARPTGEVVQVGIVSFGRRCGSRRYPGVYAELNNAEISSWIKQQIADRNSPRP